MQPAHDRDAIEGLVRQAGVDQRTLDSIANLSIGS